MGKTSGYEDTPFSLGIEGEQWEHKLPGLVIPTGKFIVGPDRTEIRIAIVKGDDGYGIVSHSKWEQTDNVLMAASIVRTMLGEIDNGET